VVAPKVIAGIAFGACALLAIAYFLGGPTPGAPAPVTAPAAKAAPKPQAATVQSGVVLLPGETLVAPPEPVSAPAPAAAPEKPAARPSPPRYNKPKAPVVAREAPRSPPPRPTRSVCVNCGVVTSVSRTDYDWEVRVRFEDGSREILRFYDRPRAQVGDAVRLEDGRLYVDN
jgi:hypothetical protein